MEPPLNGLKRHYKAPKKNLGRTGARLQYQDETRLAIRPKIFRSKEKEEAQDFNKVQFNGSAF